jgi:hypothetical protein
MAVGAAAVTHFDCKLIAVGVVMTVDAPLRFHLEVVSRTLPFVATRTRDRLMPSFERKLRTIMLLHAEQGRPEAMFVVARGAVGRSEPTSMDITMTVRALLKLQAAISLWPWKLG